ATVSVRALMARYSAGAMSIFGVGGTIGMALVPLTVTGLVGTWGLRGTLWLLVPALGVAGVLMLRGLHRLDLTRPAVDGFGMALSEPEGRHVRSFGGDVEAPARPAPAPIAPLLYLAVATLVRSVGQVAVSSFLPLYYVSKGFSEGYASV